MLFNLKNTGNHIEFEPKLMIGFAPLKNKRKHQKQEKTFRVDTDKSQLFSLVFGVLLCFSKPA
jgi:hypothetical protein